MSQAKDHFGTEINPGAILAYPLIGRGLHTIKRITVSRVVESPNGTWITGLNERGRRVSVRNLQNTFVKP